MDVHLANTIIDDVQTLWSVLKIYLSTDGSSPSQSQQSTFLPRSRFFEVCALLLEGDEAWEKWLYTNAPKEIVLQLESNPLGLPAGSSTASDTGGNHSRVVALVDFARVLSLSVLCDLSILPFWGLKINHIGGSFRTQALAQYVDDNVSKGYMRGAGVFDQIVLMLTAPPPSTVFNTFMRGSTSVCLLGLLRNFSLIRQREEDMTPADAYAQSLGPQTYSYTKTGGMEQSNKGASMALMHGNVSQSKTGRPKGNDKYLVENRASGNVYYDSQEGLDGAQALPEFWERERQLKKVTEPPQISPVGRALISILLHPLELIAVRQVTSTGPEYSTFMSSIRTIYNESVVGGSYRGFFRGWRSTMINSIVLPSGGWFMMGIPYLIRVRRMLPVPKTADMTSSGSTFANLAGVDSLGKSLEVLRSILSPSGGGFPALLAGADCTARAIIPSFICLVGARLLVHGIFGRSERARIRRVRRNTFIRAFFQATKMPQQKF